MKQLVLGILAHVDAGKTTLSEALLYRTGAIRDLGRVDHKNAHMDTHALERARGITIFLRQARMTLGDTAVTLLDTPGHVDFSAEMERTLQVLDYAVLVISGTDGVQAHGAFVFCLPSVEPELRMLEQVGRAGVKAAAVPLSAVPVPERRVRPVTFTVQSARLDAVLSGMFRLSRTSAAAQIRAGAVHLNYAECLRPDAPVAAGDVLSLRGAGKGVVTEVGGQSRKGRQFVTAELWQ